MEMTEQQKHRLQVILTSALIIIFLVIIVLVTILIATSISDRKEESKTEENVQPVVSVMETETEPEPELEPQSISELEIISIFSGSKPDEDAKFLQIIGDGKGLPTIQEVDACWKFMHSVFHVSGYVSNDGINEIFVNDISNYVTEKLGGDPKKVFEKGKSGNQEIANLSIYIERNLAEEISVKVFNENVNEIFGNTQMPLTYNQKLAIGEEIWLGAWHGGLTDTWELAEEQYSVGSQEFYLFIWDHFWYSLVKEGTETGSAKATDSLFKLFATGEAPRSSEEVYENRQMVYYTASQLREVGATSLNPGR